MPFDAFLDAVEADPEIELHSLLVLRRGETLLEAYWEPWTATDRPLVYSVSKTVTGSAVGIAIGEGRFGYDTRLVDLAKPARPVHPRVAELTVHHLLSMSTGHDDDTYEPVPDPLQLFLDTPPQTPVGSRHVYNNGASWVLGELVRRVTGQSLMDYLRPRLFEPLGIDPTWDVDQFGRELGLSGVHLTTRELARLGELYRLGGTWQGRQLIPAGHIARAAQLQIPTDPAADREWTCGYGYQVWISREGFRLDGAYGQFSLVLPEREAVIAITSAQASGSQGLLDAVFEHLVPLLDGRPLGPAPTPLRLATAANDGGDGPWYAALPADDLPWAGETRLERRGSDWELTLGMAGVRQPLTVPATAGWHRTSLRDGAVEVPVALSIGTRSDQSRLLLAFTDTVHILELDLGHGDGEARWRTAPLRAVRLADLVAL